MTGAIDSTGEAQDKQVSPSSVREEESRDSCDSPVVLEASQRLLDESANPRFLRFQSKTRTWVSAPAGHVPASLRCLLQGVPAVSPRMRQRSLRRTVGVHRRVLAGQLLQESESQPRGAGPAGPGSVLPPPINSLTRPQALPSSVTPSPVQQRHHSPRPTSGSRSRAASSPCPTSSYLPAGEAGSLRRAGQRGSSLPSEWSLLRPYRRSGRG